MSTARIKLPSFRFRFRSVHFSYAATTAQWWHSDTDGNLVCYRDLHLTNHTAKMVGYRIREVEIEAGEWEKTERPDEWASELVGYLGPAEAWAKEKQRGPSASEIMNRIGLRFRRADDNLAAAVDQVRDRLLSRSKHPTEKDEKGRPAMTVPGLRVHKSCVASLESIPSLTADKNDPDLPDPKSESSAFKAMCYACMSRPVAAEKPSAKDDDLWDDKPKPKRRNRTGMPGMW